MMLFRFVAALSFALIGVESTKYDCKSRGPDCLYEAPFSPEAIKAHERSGNFIPSDKFLQQNCKPFIKHLECARGYYEACADKNTVFDIDAAVSNVEEFCDEKSDIRKDYVTYVDCFNGQNFTNQDCFIAAQNTLRKLFSKNSKVTYEESYRWQCLDIQVITPCAVDVATERCGAEAGRIAAEIMKRVSKIASCRESDKDYFDGLIADLNS